MKTAKQVVLVIIFIVFLSILSGCGGGGGNTPPQPTITAVTVSCGSTSVQTSQPSQCSATVSGTGNFNSSVNWSVNNVSSGDPTVGTISSAGLYTAPTAVPTPYTVTINATSAADATKSASVPIVVAGTIASVSQPIIAATGGTITLPDGSSVIIASNALPSDQAVTFSEVSYLAAQPNNAAIRGVGPGLVLAFSNPVPASAQSLPAIEKESTRARAAQKVRPDSGITAPSPFQFVINSANNNVSGLKGAIPMVDFVDTSNNNTFMGALGNSDSTTAVVTDSIGTDQWSAILVTASNGVQSIVVSAVNLVVGEASVGVHVLTAPSQLSLSIDPSDSTKDVWTKYTTSTCPAGTKTLLVVHGMNDYVEQGFSTGNSLKSPPTPAMIQPILSAGGYTSALGFDYDWTQHIDSSGMQLATFLNTVITQCPSVHIDIEAHSEGVPVGLSALVHLGQISQSELKNIDRFVALGGPIMGTPMATDARALAAVLMAASELDLGSDLVLDGFSDLLNRPFVADLGPSNPGSKDTLDNIRTSLSSSSINNSPQIFVVAGNNPQTAGSTPLRLALQTCAALMNLQGAPYSDGFIPVSSALAFQPSVGDSNVLKVYPSYPMSTDHVGLIAYGNAVTSVGEQVNNTVLTSPSLALSSSASSPQCSPDGLVCSGVPGTIFSMSGDGYSQGGNGEFELFETGEVTSLSVFTSPDGSVPQNGWLDPTSCSTASRTVVFFARNKTSQQQSNAVTEEVIAGTCVPNIVIAVSPSTAQLPVNGLQQFIAQETPASANGLTWSVGGVTGGNSTVGTISTAGLYTAPAAVPNPATVTVTATSQDGSGASGSADVTIGPYTVKNLYSFTSLSDGAAPSAPLIQAKDGYFYGTTQLGGANGDGTVFKVDTGGNVTSLHEFTGTDGANSNGALVQATDGNFYGTTDYGGTHDEGTIFKMDSLGNISSLYSFSGIGDGARPLAGLIQGKDGYFYGTTVGGGTSNSGTVFKTDLSGNLVTLYSFSGGADGYGPEAPLIQATDGLFYGTTDYGGVSCGTGGGATCGTIFQIDSLGNLTTLYAFTGGQDGANPDEALLEASDGFFYGTTLFGGDSSCSVSPYTGCGTVFKIDFAGKFTLLHAFSGKADGGVPFSSLLQAGDGDFYGTTTAGGNPSCSVIASNENYSTYIGCGTVFKMDLAGNVNALYSFAGSPSDGSNPFAALLLGNDGYFYGTTRWGGTATCSYTNNGGCGTFFRLSGPGGPVPQVHQIKSPRTGPPSQDRSLVTLKKEPVSPMLGVSTHSPSVKSVPLKGLRMTH